MNLQQIVSNLGGGGISVILFVLLTLVEVTPIKINPWSGVLNWIGRKANGDLYNAVKGLTTDVEKLKKDFEVKNANDLRWSILGFANSCKKGERHSSEEWQHAVDQMAFYEDYVEKHDITNGVITEDTKYLRELYRKISIENDFE